VRCPLSSALLLSLLVGSGCGPSAGNDRTAELRQSPGGQQLVLTGRRLLMAHDPISALRRQTYRDSITFQPPAAASGIIAGPSIPVAPGYYAYRGAIRLQPDARKVTVNLSYDNTDDRRLVPLRWNGAYYLIMRTSQ
jgi:hypothetical protein